MTVSSARPYPVEWPGWPAAYRAWPGACLYRGDVRTCLRAMPARSVQCCVTSPPYWGLRDYGTDGQVGMEASPDCGTQGQAQCGGCFVCSMVAVFREVHRVLRDDGTCWLNLGDSYLPSGNLVGVPWRVALALQADGWVLRSDIIWYSPNKMPESVLNRCSKSHEHIFLLTKSQDYYYDGVAIKEESSNKRDVWVVPTRGYSGAHYATFSPRLITPCILAGTSEHGCCSRCRRPWERVVVRIDGQVNEEREAGDDLSRDRSFDWSRNGLPGSKSTLDGVPAVKETVGWQAACGCGWKVTPCVVLDPFVGSGTTVATALTLGRAGVGVDLSEVYLRDNAVPRIEEAMGLPKVRTTRAMPADVPPAPRKMWG